MDFVKANRSKIHILQDEFWRKTRKLLAEGRMSSALFGYSFYYKVCNFYYNLAGSAGDRTTTTCIGIFAVSPAGEVCRDRLHRSPSLPQRGRLKGAKLSFISERYSVTVGEGSPLPYILTVLCGRRNASPTVIEYCFTLKL